MSKFWVIFKQEYAQVVKKKSFIIGIILIPAMMMIFTLLPMLLVRQEASTSVPVNIIDRSGLEVGQKFSEALTKYKIKDTETPYYKVDTLIARTDLTEAEFKALDSTFKQQIVDGELEYFLVIGPNPHLADSNVYVVTNKENFVTYNRFSRQLSNILSEYRLSLADVNVPIDSIMNMTSSLDLITKDVKGDRISFQVKYFSGLIFVMIIYGMIFGYGQMIMRSVIEEKNSRIMEVLVSSVSPLQLMLGKILGLCAANFTQVGVWVAIGAGIYFMKGSFGMDPGIDRIIFDPFIIFSFVIFFILGYLLYASLFALLGSIVNSDKESQPFIFPIVMCLMLPVILGIKLVQDPNGILALALSYFPMTAPTTNVMRVIFVAPSLTEISFFSGLGLQTLIAIVILTLTVFGVIWMTSKVFRIGILMYGKRPTLPEIMKWLKYK